MEWDLIIAGAGPSGSSAACVAAAAGWRVLLVEQGHFPRDRVCGEFISAEAHAWLAELIPDAWSQAAPIIEAEFVSSGGIQRRIGLPRPAQGLSRLTLDAALVNAATRRGAECWTGARILEVCPSAVTILRDGVRRQESCRHFLLAAGRWWSIGGVDGAPRRLAPWLGVKAHFECRQPLERVEMYLFPGGYCGLSPVEGGQVNACCLTHRRRAGSLHDARDFATWIAAVSRHPALLRRFREAHWTAPTQSTPTVQTVTVAPGPAAALNFGIPAAGDAAGFIDPWTGDGLARALLSGRLAAECLLAGADRGQLRRSARRGLRVAGAFRLLLQSPAWTQDAALAGLGWSPIARKVVDWTRWKPPDQEKTRTD